MKVKVKNGDDEKDGKQIEDLKTLPQIAEPPVKGRFRKQISRSRQEKRKGTQGQVPVLKDHLKQEKELKKNFQTLLNRIHLPSLANKYALQALHRIFSKSIIVNKNLYP